MARSLVGYKRLFDTVKKGDIRPLYFLYGPEVFIKKEFVNELIRHALEDKDRSFNLDILHGDEFDKNAFDDRVGSFPLFAQRRVLVLKKFDSLVVSNKDFVIERLEGIASSLVVVVESELDKLDNARVKKLDKLAKAQGVSFRFQHLDDDETVQRVKSRLRREGLDIEPEALDVLVTSVGNNLSDLVNELEKIIVSVEDDKVIRADTVSTVVGRYRTENIFALLDGLGRRHVADLVQRAHKLIDSGEEPVMVCALILRRVIQLLHVKMLQSEGRGARGAAGVIPGVSPFMVSRLVEQAGRVETDALELHLGNFRWVDIKMKSSSIHPRTLIETGLVASAAGRALAGPVDGAL